MTTANRSKSNNIVPPSGFTARLTIISAAAMGFLAVFALALSLATDRMATRWGDELARSSTIRISAPDNQIAAQTQAALNLLETTSGVLSARALTAQEQKDLLKPWFGDNLSVDNLAIPQLIEVIEDANGYDANGLRLRLAGEVPGAVLDDHTRWRKPLVKAARHLRRLGWLSLALIAVTTAAMITLAANSALAANAKVISVLRLIGATDAFIAHAFVRRFTIRAFLGAGIGTIVAVLLLWFLPSTDIQGGFLTGLGFKGFQWAWPVIVPPLAGVVGYVATRLAARKTLKDMT